MGQDISAGGSRDEALGEVEAAIRRADPDGARWAQVIRHTYDMIYNGRETGRYRVEQLMKTEKTHIGSLFEINAGRAFGFEGGEKLDFLIAGHEVDAKWSQKDGGWMLPPEVFDQIALVSNADDARAVWSLGLIRVTADVRREGGNRDKKSQLRGDARSKIKWIWRNSPLPPNVLLQLSPERVAYIFDHRHGTQRLHRLFREAEGMLVHRNTVETVARQLDSQKRVRENGGSRSVLALEGYLILSGAYHSVIAKKLGVPVPSPQEYLSVRVVPSDDGRGAMIAGERWRIAEPTDVVKRPAPPLKEEGSGDDLE